MINKIGRPSSGSPICLITSMITDQIGRQKVLLPINHNYNNICDSLIRLFKIKTQEIKNSESFVSVRWRVLSNYLGMTHTVQLHMTGAEIRRADSQSDLRILL